MSDLAILPTENGANIKYNMNGDFQLTDSLFNSVYLALFSDLFWGNQLLEPSHKLNSTFNSLLKENLTTDTRRRSEIIAEKALEFLTTENIVNSLQVDSKIINSGFLEVTIKMEKPNGDILNFKFGLNWEAQSVEINYYGFGG